MGFKRNTAILQVSKSVVAQVTSKISKVCAVVAGVITQLLTSKATYHIMINPMP